MTISNIHELKEFLLNCELTNKQKADLICTTLGVFGVIDESSIDYVILNYEEFYYKYPIIEERPLLLMMKMET